MDDSHQNNNSANHETLEELKNQIKEAKSVLSILKPLADEGEIYKGIFNEIKQKIETSYGELKSSKGINTKYSRDLEKTKEQIDEFIKETNNKRESLKKLITSIGNLEQRAKDRFSSIEKLKSEANDSKKLVTEAKNDAQKLVADIKSFKEESLKKIKELRGEKKESERIQKFLKQKEIEVQKLYEQISKKHSDLFTPQIGKKKSKTEELDSNIRNIELFDEKLEKEIKPNLEEKENFLSTVETDIKTKQKEITALLSDATVKTLAQGYMESMEEYSIKKELKSKKAKFNKRLPLDILYNCYAGLFNHVLRHGKSILNYLTFITPLLIICLIFIESELFNSLLKIEVEMEDFSGAEFTFYKVMLSIPLLWISWFGQKNISQRKRLFEEYNHKLRVVQMYLMFDTNETYNLEQKTELENTLLEVIRNNPAEHLGKGETMIDRFLDKFRIEGFYKKLKEEIIEDLKNLTTKND